MFARYFSKSAVGPALTMGAFIVGAFLVCASPVFAAVPTEKTPGQVIHEVRRGQTLGGIARQYGTTVDEICRANRIQKNNTIREKQQLVIPSNAPAPRTDAATSAVSSSGPPQRLALSGNASGYYYEPAAKSGQLPVFMVLHGRGANAAAFCDAWAPVVRPMGWLVCPTGHASHGGGNSWANDWVSGRKAMRNALTALRDKYGRRVQLYGNTLIGFSEGAFVAMNVGVREPRTYNRWLILGASASYWGALGDSLLAKSRASVRRVGLITGQLDIVHPGTLQTQSLLKKQGISVRLWDPEQMGHVVDLQQSRQMYEHALRWLNG